MQDDFGAELRRARQRKGFDVNTVARRLRIRPDIIQAIEESDFDRMPPRGYARNMINSYAHLLGLNASEITRSYLDAQYAHQVNAARKNARGTGFEMPVGRRSASAAERQQRVGQYEVSGYEQGDLSQLRNVRSRERLRGQERGGRRMYDDFDSGRIMNRSEAERTYRNAGHRSRNTALGEEPYFNAVASPAPTRTFGGRFSFLQNMNLPLIAVIAVAAILLIVVLVLAFGPKGSSEDTESMPVASASEASSTSSSTVGVAAPTSFTFSYTVNSGTSTWIEVYIDGRKEIAENVEGPSTKAFTTSGVLEFICADPSGVKATQDGKDIPLTPNAEGIVDIKIDFNDVLRAWQEEHGVAPSSSASSSSSSSGLRGIDNEARAASSAAQNEDDDDEGYDDEDDYYEDEWTDDDYYEDEYNDEPDYYEEDVQYYEE